MSRMVKIMLLDDEPIVGKRLKPAIDKMGCTVEVFENPREALERLRTTEFDIVVTDIRMEEITGMDILEYLQKNKPQTKVIMITGYAKMDLAREAMGKGVFDFIAKPFRPDDLRQTIARAAGELGFHLSQI